MAIDVERPRSSSTMSRLSFVMGFGMFEVRPIKGPGTLENNSLSEALLKISGEYEAISNLIFIFFMNGIRSI